jgi:hypothetical protein
VKYFGAVSPHTLPLRGRCPGRMRLLWQSIELLYRHLMIRLTTKMYVVMSMTVILSLTYACENAFAHPGGLDANGCHTNRKTGKYHCHNQNKVGTKIPCDVSAGYCHGCGCHGGPGYRNNYTGKCVSFKHLQTECGNPPTTNCVFENAPGTGANKECAL